MAVDILLPWPEWLEQHLVPDEAFAEAYEITGEVCRSHIKQAIAQMAAVFGLPSSLEERRVAIMRQGGTLHTVTRPADWAIVFVNSQCQSPARLLAALMPAIAAGVPHVLVCRVALDTEQERCLLPLPLLATLELAGVEWVVSLAPERAASLLHGVMERQDSGSVVFVGASDFGTLSEKAREGGLRVFSLPERVVVAVDGALPAACRLPGEDVLRLMHPDARIVPAEAGVGQYSAVYCAEDAVGRWLPVCPLVLAPGYESLWLWSGLVPAFFMYTHHAFAPAS